MASGRDTANYKHTTLNYQSSESLLSDDILYNNNPIMSECQCWYIWTARDSVGRWGSAAVRAGAGLKQGHPVVPSTAAAMDSPGRDGAGAPPPPHTGSHGATGLGRDQLRAAAHLQHPQRHGPERSTQHVAMFRTNKTSEKIVDCLLIYFILLLSAYLHLLNQRPILLFNLLNMKNRWLRDPQQVTVSKK